MHTIAVPTTYGQRGAGGTGGNVSIPVMSRNELKSAPVVGWDLVTGTLAPTALRAIAISRAQLSCFMASSAGVRASGKTAPARLGDCLRWRPRPGRLARRRQAHAAARAARGLRP